MTQYTVGAFIIRIKYKVECPCGTGVFKWNFKDFSNEIEKGPKGAWLNLI
jgi:hypothetical protein